jgi:hypothetical protein
MTPFGRKATAGVAFSLHCPGDTVGATVTTGVSCMRFDVVASWKTGISGSAVFSKARRYMP